MSLGLRADVLVSLSSPKFTSSPDVLVRGATVTDRVSFEEKKYLSDAIVVASPDLGARVDF